MRQMYIYVDGPWILMNQYSTRHSKDVTAQAHTIMSPTNSFVAGLLSLASLRPRQSPEFPEYLTVVTEPSAVCRMYADMLGDVSFTFYDSPSVNITCWTQSSMLDDEKGRYDGSSWIWAWVQLDPEEYPDPQTEIGVGNAEQGGVAGGYGCWTHEDDMQVGDLYLPDEIQECGDAPHHQVCLDAEIHTLATNGRLLS